MWDGNKVHIDCRCETDRELTGALLSDGEWTPITNWTVDGDGLLRYFPTIPAGSVGIQVRVATIQDNIDEPDETFNLSGVAVSASSCP